MIIGSSREVACGLIEVVPTIPRIRQVLGTAAVPSPEPLIEDQKLLLAYTAENFARGKVPCLGQGILDPCLACLGIVKPASVGCSPNGEVAEVVDEVIVGYEENAEVHEVHNLETRVGETVGLEREATSGFVEHIHNYHLPDQETIQILPFDPASQNLEGRLS